MCVFTHVVLIGRTLECEFTLWNDLQTPHAEPWIWAMKHHEPRTGPEAEIQQIQTSIT